MAISGPLKLLPSPSLLPQEFPEIRIFRLAIAVYTFSWIFSASLKVEMEGIKQLLKGPHPQQGPGDKMLSEFKEAPRSLCAGGKRRFQNILS